jgi:hypothetical protein
MFYPEPAILSLTGYRRISANVNKLSRGSALISKRRKYWLYNKPFSTLLPLAPKVFASQKRFSATPTRFSGVYKSLTC